jgi:molybdopterin biosynthesis enzyme
VQVKNGLVEKVPGASSVLSSTTRADGFVIVPADMERYNGGETVCVWEYSIP